MDQYEAEKRRLYNDPLYIKYCGWVPESEKIKPADLTEEQLLTMLAKIRGVDVPKRAAKKADKSDKADDGNGN
jgi:hypothetical protein